MKARSVMMAASLVAVFAAGTAYAAKVKNVFVVEATVEAQCDDCKGIKKAELREITNELRRVAVNSLPKDRYNVMTKETVQAQGSQVLQECADANCVIQVGSAVGADFIVKGSINKFGPKFSLTVEIYETKDGNLVGALADPVRSEKLIDILEKIAAGCTAMYKKFLSEQNPQPQVQPQPPAPTPPTPTPQPAYQPPAPSATVDASGVLTDSRDGKRYKTVVIGGKKWMAENLNYQTKSGSWCFNNDNSYCGKYGRMYDWKTAKTVCPTGYHLPSRQEWKSLVDYAGGDNAAGKKLKVKSGWDDNKGQSGNGTDDFGFSALPGGLRLSDRYFLGVGIDGLWWTATEGDGSYAYHQSMGYVYDGVKEIYSDYEGDAFSVRCVAD